MDLSKISVFVSIAIFMSTLFDEGSSAQRPKCQIDGKDPPIHVIFPVIYSKSTTNTTHNLLDLNSDFTNLVQHLYVKFTYEGRNHRLRLKLNSKINGLEGVRRLPSSQRPLCYYYQGLCTRSGHSSSDVPDELVTLSLCPAIGLRGTLHLDGTPHLIKPYSADSSSSFTIVGSLGSSVDYKSHCYPHVMYKLPAPRDGWCGNLSGQWTPFDKLHRNEFFSRMYTNIKSEDILSRTRRSAEAKYIELALILDSTLMSQFSSEDDALDHILQITNMIDMYYQKLGLRVGLTYWEFWKMKDEVNISLTNQRETLQRFLAYGGEKFTADNKFDVIHLISGRAINNMTSSLTIPDSVCTDRAVGVVSTLSTDIQRLASILSHLIGHIIGLNHDTKECACPDRLGGCIMASSIDKTNPTEFSDCSYKRMQVLDKAGLGLCLTDEASSSSYPQSCGNGFVERGEQCDCGSEAECEETDPCCDASTCLLKSWAQCSTGPCCHECVAKPSNNVCRPSAGPCDAAEFCDGLSGQCPDDVIIADGEPCLQGEGYCHQGKCPTRDAQCQRYWGPQSESAQAICFDYNKLDSKFGHCGFDVKTGYPVKCEERDKFCGLLQCDGGSDYPIVAQLAYQTTSAGTSHLEQYKCKTVRAADSEDVYQVGLIDEGTKCGNKMICLNKRCQQLQINDAAKCPLSALTNQTCSGHGRCTVVGTCSCDYGYTGGSCDEVLPLLHTSPPSIADQTDAPVMGPALDTKYLIAIICSVAVVLILALVIGLIFCRRRIVTPKKVKSTKSHLDQSQSTDRTISFGQTPSYRNEKLGRKKKRRKRRESSSDSGETDSDDRVDAVAARRSPVSIPAELSRQPERGILKNSSSTYGVTVDDGDDLADACSSNCSCSDAECRGHNSCSCSEQEDKVIVELHEQPSASIHRRRSDDDEVDIAPPPPLEFDTSPYNHRKVKVDLSKKRDISPTNSEDGKYCSATEADQYYKTVAPFNRYNELHTVVPAAMLNSNTSNNMFIGNHKTPAAGSHGTDSATDSAIDMPADGSMSTINEVPLSVSLYKQKDRLHYNIPASTEQSDQQSDESFTQDTTSLVYSSRKPAYFHYQPNNLYNTHQQSSPVHNPKMYNSPQSSRPNHTNYSRNHKSNSMISDSNRSVDV